MPGQFVFIAQTQTAAVFITREWEATIKSRRLMDCVGAMRATLNAVREQLNASVGIDLLETENDDQVSFSQQMDRERTRERYASYAKAGVLMLVGAVISALVSALIAGIG